MRHLSDSWGRLNTSYKSKSLVHASKPRLPPNVVIAVCVRSTTHPVAPNFMLLTLEQSVKFNSALLHYDTNNKSQKGCIVHRNNTYVVDGVFGVVGSGWTAPIGLSNLYPTKVG